jgi:hypothetical protein
MNGEPDLTCCTTVFLARARVCRQPDRPMPALVSVFPINQPTACLPVYLFIHSFTFHLLISHATPSNTRQLHANSRPHIHKTTMSSPTISRPAFLLPMIAMICMSVLIPLTAAQTGPQAALIPPCVVRSVSLLLALRLATTPESRVLVEWSQLGLQAQVPEN